jgi:hypothetical protein
VRFAAALFMFASKFFGAARQRMRAADPQETR